MHQRILHLNRKLLELLSSHWFFYTTVLVFTVSALWVATASLYPMAFDEDFHMGLIRIYATSWLPYGIEHTRDMATYGAATADPSYVFHYLMSMPYRLFIWLGLSETTAIVFLRFINIALVVTALWLYRKALLASNVSKALAHSVLACFMLIPILPVIAGQVNYDNLLLILVALAMLLTIKITASIRASHKLPAAQTWFFLGVILIGMPIKYAFLPIALALLIWFVAVSVKYKGTQSFASLIKTFTLDSRHLQKVTKVGIILLLAFGVFFSAHYVVNYVQYGNLIPPCEVVFDTEACKVYGPWNRDQELKKSLSDSFVPMSLPAYVVTEWVPDMLMRLTFAVAGPTNNYETRDPLVLPVVFFGIVALVGTICSVRFVKPLFRKWPFAWLTLLVTLIYLTSLIWSLYKSYVATGEPVAINGRYLLPLLPFVGAVMGAAILSALRAYNLRRWAAIIAATCILVLSLEGGGIGTYIVRADSDWFWDGWGQSSHQVLKTIVDPIIID